MSTETKIKLSSEDWKNLVPIKTVEIGSQKITIRPFGFKNLTEVIGKLRSIQTELTELGLTLDNYNSPENVLSLMGIILSRMPEIIIESCNIDNEDLDNLPTKVVFKLVEAMLDCNIESNKGFVKNLTALASKAALLMSTQEKPE